MAASRSRSRLSLPSSSPQRPRIHVALTLLLILACLTSVTLARPDMRRASITSSASLPATASSAVSETQSIVSAEAWEELGLRRRKDEDDGGDNTSSKAEHTSKSDQKSTAKDESASKTVLTISVTKGASDATSTMGPLPTAYDGTLSTELTTEAGSNCRSFLQGVLSDPTFETCYPLSMLLQTSRNFFKAQRQLLSIVRVLDATCAANVTSCTEFFNAAAANITAEENCKAEWKADNSLVKQAVFGLKSYEMMYKAACLQNPDDDMYCYADAVTNLTSASDAYFYFLPYNLTLPGSSVPSCNWCIRETMAIFHAASADRDQYIADTYEPAARQVNTICGSDFVNGTLPEAQTSAGPIFIPSWTMSFAALLGAAFLNVIL